MQVYVEGPRCAGKKVKARITLKASGGKTPYTYNPAQNFNYEYESDEPARVPVEVLSKDGQRWSSKVNLPAKTCPNKED